MMIHGLDALDYYLYFKYPFIQDIINNIDSLDKLYCIIEYITFDYIKASPSWLNNCYLKEIKEKNPQYLKSSNIDNFVDYASKEIDIELK